MRGGEMDARRLRVVREDLAQPVGLHLADERHPAAKGGNADGGICTRAAGNLSRGAHVLEELSRLLLGNQAHHALGDIVARKEGFLDARKDIDDGIADGEYIESRLGHDFLWKAGSKGKRRPYRIGLALASRGHYLIGAMINAAFSALSDVLSPDFRSVLFKAVGLAVALLIAVIAGTVFLLDMLKLAPWGWGNNIIEVAAGLGM